MAKKDLVEIFGYAPADVTPAARLLWQTEACPFINGPCIKYNHDKTIVYGTCSVTSDKTGTPVIICPNRLYADQHGTIRKVAADAFGSEVKFYMYGDFIREREQASDCVVALGKNSGKEVQIRGGGSLSIDWVLARISNWKLSEYVGLEIQSIDITGNYRDAWYGYRDIEQYPGKLIPASGHGLNWANVHKRLIPQLISKGTVFSRSQMVKKGLYFVVPDVVYKRFEAIVGDDIPTLPAAQTDSISVLTYDLGPPVPPGAQRTLVHKRTIRFLLEEFAERVISGPNLPSGELLDAAIFKALGLKP